MIFDPSRYEAEYGVLYQVNEHPGHVPRTVKWEAIPGCGTKLVLSLEAVV